MFKKIFSKIIIFLISLIFSLFVAELVLNKIDHSFSKIGSHRMDNQDYILNKETIVDEEKFYRDYFYADLIDQDQIIVALGDSFTAGYPVSSENRYTEVLKSHFQEQSVGVINMGVGDSGSDQQLNLFKRHILSRVNPDVVVWQFYPNDIWDNLNYSLYSLTEGGELIALDGRESWYYKKMKLYRQLSFLGKIRDESQVIQYLLAAVQAKHIYKEVPSTFSNKNYWSLSKIKEEVKAMNSLAEEHDFKVFYLLIAPEAAYLDDPQTTWIIDDYRALYQILSKEKTFIDGNFSKLTSDQTESTNANLSSEELAEMVFQRDGLAENMLGDSHFNQLGYRFLGELVYKNIKTALENTSNQNEEVNNF